MFFGLVSCVVRYSMAIQRAQTEFFYGRRQYLFEFLICRKQSAKSLKCLNAAGIRPAFVDRPMREKWCRRSFPTRDKALFLPRSAARMKKKMFADFSRCAHLRDFAERNYWYTQIQHETSKKSNGSLWIWR